MTVRMSVGQLVDAGYVLVRDGWGWRAVRPAEAPSATGKPAPPDPGVVNGLLLRRFNVSWRNLGPEDVIQADLVRRLDDLTGRGVPVLVAMTANEVRLPIPPAPPPGRHAGEAARRASATAGLRRWLVKVAESLGGRLLAMGLLPGFPDLIVLWRDAEGRPGVAFLETKIPGGDVYVGKTKGRTMMKKRARGKLSEEQRIVLPLLAGWGFNVGVYRSADEGMERLRGWGAPV